MEAAWELKQAVTDYRAGRQEAFTMLYERSSKYIYTCIYKVMQGNDNIQDAIGDIMQDTYVEISRNIGQLGNEDSFLSWAGTIATRKCYAWLKKNRRYVLLNEEDDMFENLADDDTIIPEEVMQSREKQRLVRQIIDTQLTQMQKICIVSYYFNEQKQSEIAQELGIPENTVKTNLSRAKAKIKNGVLDLEKKQGTKLYSVAPLLLLLFKEDVEACTVPYAAAKKAGSVVSAISSEGAGSAASATAATGLAATTAAGAGLATAAATGTGKTLSGKMVSLSLKAKITTGVIAAGIVAAVIGGTVYMTGQEKREVWAPEEEEENFEETAEREDASVGEEEPIPMEQVPLSASEKEDLKMLVSMLTLNSHFFGEDMDRNEYPVWNVGRGVQMITILGADEAYEKYLPPVEIDETNWIGYVKAEDMQFYLETVFGVQDADLSAYCENDKVVCGLGGNMIETETSITQSDTLDGLVYEISGTCSVMEEDMVSTYPYCLMAARNEESVFGFWVMSMQYKDGEESVPDHINAGQINAGESLLADVLLHPQEHSDYYPSGVDYQNVYFAMVDVDQDGEEEIFLGSAGDIHPNFGPNWITIFNILKYDRANNKVSDFDKDMVYEPLDAMSWHFYDTGILMTMAEAGRGHSNFWNLLTGEFTDTAIGNPDHEELSSGNEIPIVWYEVNQENVSALAAGESGVAAYIPVPYGTYSTNRGTKLEFFEDGKVMVSEGGSHKIFEFTIDGGGKLVIDPLGEALEGTYNAETDVIVIDMLKFRK